MQPATRRLLSFAQAVEGFMLTKSAEGLSRSTLADYRGSVQKLSVWLEGQGLAGVAVDQLTTLHLRRFLADLQHRDPPLAPKTIRNVYTFLSSFWSWLGVEFGFPHILRGAIRPPRANPPAMRLPTQEELERLLRACEWSREAHTVGREPFRMRRPTARRDVAILLTLVDTGLRAQELCRLTLADLDKNDGSLLVRFGKGRKQRIAYLGKRARRALWRYLATDRQGAKPDEALFMGLGGRPLTVSGLSQLVRKLGRRVGVKVSPHMLRHVFATEFLRGGGSTLVLRRLLGHASDGLLARYAEIAEVDLKAAHDAASPVDRLRL